MTYTAKGTPPGYDVKTAADFLQAFNSSWPLLKIEHHAAASITLNSTPQTIYAHNLGYPCMFVIIRNGQIVALPPGIGVDSSVLAYDGTEPVGGTYSFYFFVFRLPLDQSFTAPNIATAEARSIVDNNYVLKVSLPGKSVHSSDLRDFAIHTATRSLMVHKVSPGTLTGSPGSYSRTVPHGLEFIPTAFCYMKFGAGLSGYNSSYFYSINGPQGTQDAYYTVDTTNMVISEVSAFSTAPADATAVFLKDPFQKQQINVSFP
jgi:hypothetical protein